MGDSPVVVFLLLLWTSEARGSHCVQSSGFADVTVQRYCSTHWFFLSERLSVCGWNAVEMFRLILSFVVRAFPNCDVNLGSLSEMTLDGRPNHG